MVRANLPNEFVFGPCFGSVVNLETLVAEGLYGLLADVLEEENAEIFLVYGMVMNHFANLTLPAESTSSTQRPIGPL